MSIVFRAPILEDCEAIDAISKALYPDSEWKIPEWPQCRENMTEWMTAISHPPENRFYIVGVDSDSGSVVGCASLRQESDDKTAFRMRLSVNPEWHGRGIGSAFFDSLIQESRRREACAVRARVREDRKAAISFLMSRGFYEYERMVDSRLNVKETNIRNLPRSEDNLEADGIVISSLVEERLQRPDCLQAVFDLEYAVRADLPDPGVPRGFADFKRWIESPRILQEGYFIARSGSLYVGLTGLSVEPADTTCLNQDLTGVRREYRRRGISTALKIHAIEYAQKNGFRQIITRNMSINTAMLTINQMLGFRHFATEIRLQKTL